MIAHILSFRTFSLKLSLSKFLQMRLNSFLFRVLPFAISRFYLATMGRLYYLLHRKEKQLITATLTRDLRRLPAPDLKGKIKAAFQGIFDHYHEKLFVGYSNFPRLLQFLKKRIHFEGEEALQEALKAGKGVLLVTGHYGAVEFLPGVLAVNGYPASMICRFQTNRLRQSLGKRAEQVGLNLIDADDGNIVLSAMQALKQGRILITECDEFDEWRQDPKRYCYFLNHRLNSDRTLELLQKRSGAPVITALMSRNGRKKYTCHLTPVRHGAAARQPISEQCLEILEAAVETSPEQWYQWKKFGKMTATHCEVNDDRQQSGYLAPEIALSVPDQA